MHRLILWICLVILVGCGKSSSDYAHMIGRDPTWFPLQLYEKSLNVTAFSTALAQEIGRLEHVPLHVINIDWVQLFESLDQERIGGVFTSLTPSLLAEEKYAFSDPFLLLGPVLIVNTNAAWTSLDQLEGKIVGVFQYDDSVLVAQQYPSIVIQLYEKMPQVLEELTRGDLDGVLMPALDAKDLVFSLYPLQLKIVTEPLTQKGLRLATLKGRNPSLIRHFNRGLKKAEQDGTYQTLLRTYNLN